MQSEKQPRARKAAIRAFADSSIAQTSNVFPSGSAGYLLNGAFTQQVERSSSGQLHAVIKFADMKSDLLLKSRRELGGLSEAESRLLDWEPIEYSLPSGVTSASEPCTFIGESEPISIGRRGFIELEFLAKTDIMLGPEDSISYWATLELEDGSPSYPGGARGSVTTGRKGNRRRNEDVVAKWAEVLQAALVHPDNQAVLQTGWSEGSEVILSGMDVQETFFETQGGNRIHPESCRHKRVDMTEGVTLYNPGMTRVDIRMRMQPTESSQMREKSDRKEERSEGPARQGRAKPPPASKRMLKGSRWLSRRRQSKHTSLATQKTEESQALDEHGRKIYPPGVEVLTFD